MDSIVTCTAVLDVTEDTVFFLARLLWLRRRELGTRRTRRSLGCHRQAVLVIRLFLDGTRIAQLAVDNGIGGSTAYRYVHEGIDVLAACAPEMAEAMAAAKSRQSRTSESGWHGGGHRPLLPPWAERCGPVVVR